jgi:hypothetical protein
VTINRTISDDIGLTDSVVYTLDAHDPAQVQHAENATLALITPRRTARRISGSVP